MFFPGKNDFLVSRGLRVRYGSFAGKGVPVVQLKGYEKYYFDPETCKVYSRQGVREFHELTPQLEGAKPYYWLYRYGVKAKVFLWLILQDNLDGIQTFFSQKKRVKDVFATQSV